jgi:PadR family transcriptional regulator AphA
MDVKTFCLGLLCFREACGYDLKKEFENHFRHFYTAGCGSIYPALASLADEGLVNCREVPQQGKPDRKVYRITEQGRANFAKALGDAKPQHKLRSEFLAMIYFADLMEPEHLQSILTERLVELRKAVSHIEEIEQKRGTDAPAGARFVAGFGAAVAKTAAEYIESNQGLLIDQKKKESTRARTDMSIVRAAAEELT